MLLRRGDVTVWVRGSESCTHRGFSCWVPFFENPTKLVCGAVFLLRVFVSCRQPMNGGVAVLAFSSLRVGADRG